MSTIGFIINGVRHGSMIGPHWFPDAGMTVWMFLSEMRDGDASRMADNLRNVQWIPDDNTHFLRRPLDVLRDVRDGQCALLPEHAWRQWGGAQRWAYFVDFDSMEYEIWRYGRFELSSGRASFRDLNWDGFCALRSWILAVEAGVTKEAQATIDADELTRALESLKVQDAQERGVMA
ncbi:hypothetical protein CspHIS471_0606280 [Cutaneotrichosporon sp. HIS471]|nr:hypothetical protein CspHIS471_0606280 [Cutaneotrichosporon sp. HIS471]